MKKFAVKIIGFTILAICCFWATSSFGQAGYYPAGQIIKPAAPTSTNVVMNPHQDWFVTKYPDYVTNNPPGFDTTKADYKANCVNQFEFPMYALPEIGKGGVLGYNIGSPCGITDLIPDKKGYSVYTVQDANNNLIFRFRLGDYNSSVEAYSILIDADQKFGRVGDPGVTVATADPNWTPGNPGFEIDITMINNSNGNSGGVFVYDIDGIASCPTPLTSYSWSSHVQISKADTYTCGDPDYFFDYYVSLTDVITPFNLNKANAPYPGGGGRPFDLSYTTLLRYAALTNQNAGCSMQGKISNISGVDNSNPTYSTRTSSGIYNSFIAVITNQCGTPFNDLASGAGGFDKNLTSPPTINGPLNVKQQIITGTTVESGIYIKVDVYPVKTISPLTWYSTSTGFGEMTEAAGVTAWSITLNRQLAAYDSVVATTQKDKFTVPCAANGANTSSTSSKVVTCLLEATLSPTNVSCNGSSDGSIATTIAAAPNNGIAPYTYSWTTSPVQTTATATNLPIGTYSLTLKDNKGCRAVISPVTITQPTALSASVVSTNVNCNGANDGTITINSPSGGYGTYQYTINGGTNWQSSGSFTGLSNGTYNVQIRDAAHTTCVVDLDGIANTTITQPATLGATVTSTNVTCNGTNDGTITISSPSGGYGTYQYSINGGASWQSSGSFTGLTNATYNVLIRDAAHASCVKDLDGAGNTTITQPTVLSATVTSTNVTCNGASDGTITISSPSGGSGAYQYSLNGGSWQSSGSFAGLSNGSYDVQIRDVAHTGCVKDLGNTAITQPTVLSATVTSTNVTCNGAGDGTITISSPSGGSGAYQYSLNGGGWQSSGSFTGLSNATYDVQIRDAAHTGCVKDLGNTVITQPAILSATVTSTNVTCNGASDGTITISSPSGGYGTYEYSINGGTNWQSSGSYNGLSSGPHDVQVRDAAHTGCAKDLGITTITQPAILSATVSSTNVTSHGANNGTIMISSPSGGYGTYEYSINGGTSWQSSGSFTGLSNGNYDVQIHDAAHTGCVKDLGSTTITEPATINATVTSTNVTCNGANDGTIIISNPTGGGGTYEYTINGGASWLSSGSFIGLSNGTYNVQIRDAAMPADVEDLDGSANTMITQPAVLSATTASTTITCNGVSDGTITISSPSGGSGAYQYSLNGGGWQSSGSFTGLSNATYDVQIRDGAHTGCVKDLGNTVISQPTVLSAAVTSTNVTCNGASDGTITIGSPSGGYGTYQFSVNGGTNWQSSGSFTGLSIGPYDVQIRDAVQTGCVKDLGITTITQPAVLSAAVTSTNVTCNGASDGTITISSPSGGYGTYEYNLNGGIWQSSGSFAGISNGSYDVQIRDAAHTGCVKDLGTTMITQPTVLSASATTTNVTGNGVSDGTITISSPSGGYGTYQFSINGGTNWQSSGSYTGLSNGPYDVQIRDAAHTGCVKDLGNTNITQPAVLSATVTSTNVTCNGASDGTITISSPSGGYGSYQFSINGGTNWQSSGSFTSLSNGTYNVLIGDAAYPTDVVDLDGAGNTTISQPIALGASVSSTNVNSFGANDGTIIISSPSGGSGAYQYSINGGASWQSSGSYTGLSNGTYNVLLRDASHTFCEKDLDGSVNTTIIQPSSPLMASVASTNVTCSGVNDGTIMISSPSGGYGTYQYSIDGGTNWQSSGSFTGLAPATTYNVFIRDAAYPLDLVDLDGAGNTTIIQPSIALTATVINTNITCNGANDGSITIRSPSGGSGTYDYSMNGTNWQSSGLFTSLAPAATYSVFIRDAAHTTCVVDLDGTGNTTITQPVALSATVTFTNVTRTGANDGTITIISPMGGYGSYEYSINGGTSWQSSRSFIGLSNGTYNVQIRDAAHTGCMTDLDGGLNTTIIQPSSPLSGSVTSTKVSCNGGNDGTITITSPSGGYGTYEYSINGGKNWQSSRTFTGLSSAPYNVQMRDAAQPTDVVDLDGAANTTIAQPSPLDGSAVVTNIGCETNNSGAIVLTMSGGTSPYTYFWSNGSVMEDISNLTKGVYSVTITDFNKCISTLSFDVNVDCVLRIYEGVSPNGDGINDYWRIDDIESYPNNRVRVFDRFDNLVYETSGYTNEVNNWQGQSNHGLVRGALPEGTYFYTVDLGNGEHARSGYVELKRH